MIWLRLSLSRGAFLTVAIASMLSACGGKVVVDAAGVLGGGGGAGGDGSVTSTAFVGAGGSGGLGSTGGAGGIGGAGGCDGLQADLVAKVAAAQACNPVLSVPQCNGGVTALDLCGCLIVANDSSAMEAKIAMLAFNAWVNAGCGPYDCESCPPGPGSPWYCDPTESVCKPAFEK